VSTPLNLLDKCLSVCYAIAMKDRATRIIDLRLKGLSYAGIGRLIGLSRQRVHQILTEYDTTVYHKLRRFILKRDKTCQRCGSPLNPHIHHIDDNAANNNPNNLLVLCASCHKMAHHGTDVHDQFPIPQIRQSSEKLRCPECNYTSITRHTSDRICWCKRCGFEWENI